jgi:hypothetical protein
MGGGTRRFPLCGLRLDVADPKQRNGRTGMDMSSRQETQLSHFLVEPRNPDAEGGAALLRLEQRVNEIAGGKAKRPASLPGLSHRPARLEVSVPSAEANGLQSEFGASLIFESNAPLRY